MDACLWKGDNFIDGATFLVPSILPEAGLECYSVDQDETTGVHHVILRKAYLHKLPLANMSIPNFSRHIAEFSNGEMTLVPRAKSELSKTLSGDHQWDSSVAQTRPVRDIVCQVQCGSFKQDNKVDEIKPVRDRVTDNHPGFPDSLLSTSVEAVSNGTTSGPAWSDSSIAVSGRVIGQRAADIHSSLSNFSESILHIVPRNKVTDPAIEAERSDAAAQGQELHKALADTQTSENSTVEVGGLSTDTSRRSSVGSQCSGIATSTAPTSPASSAFSTLPYWKSALTDLPEVLITP